MSALKHGTNTILANILFKYLHTKIISIIYKAELSIACALGKLKPVSSISLNTLGLGLEKMCLNITLKPMATATEIEAGIPTFFLALEPSRDRITGNFLSTVLQRSLPGALIVVLYVMLIQSIGPVLGLTEPQCATLSVYLTGIANIRDVLLFPRTTGSAEF